MRTMTAGPARGVALAGLVVALVLGAVWATGAAAPLADWAQAQQKAVQTALAQAVRALRSGQPGAWGALLAVCFSYGFFHAVGPGHGKAVIGGYGLARRVRLRVLVGLALASSLAQAGVAIALVAGGAYVLGWTRDRMEALAETSMVPLSYALIAGLGLWLLWRGVRGLGAARRLGSAQDGRSGGQGSGHHDHGGQGHGHDHEAALHHPEDCGCGHAHGPTVEQVAGVTGARDAALLIAAIAMRPCSGALFLLILTFAMGIGWAGVLGTLAMGLGTATVTAGVAGLAFWTREGALATLPGAGIARVLPGIELVAGAVIAALALILLAGAW